MSKQPTISTIASGFYSTTALNVNFENIRDQFDNTLSLDGSTPNAMEADLDLNSNHLLNAGDIYSDRLFLNGLRVTSVEASISWQGEWATATDYVVDQLVREDGTVYICLVDHTSGTFATDLSNSYWEIFAQKGSAGAGTGDLLSTNNLSDLVDSDAALSNLGGGSVGIAIFKDTTAAAVRTEISAQEQNDILDDLSGLTQATNKIPYFNSATTASLLDFVDEDNMASDSATAIPSQQSVKAYVDNEIAALPTPSAMTLLATVPTTSGSTITESSLSFSGYTKLEIVFSGVSVSSAASSSFINMKFGSGSYLRVTDPISSSSSDTLDGIITVHLSTGAFSSVVADSNATNTTAYAGTFGDVSSETSIKWDWSASQTFDAGQILIYGVA